MEDRLVSEHRGHRPAAEQVALQVAAIILSL
jgi:hypothetical protein